MDLVSLIVAALVVGATAEFRDTESTTVKVATSYVLISLADETGCRPGKCGADARGSYCVQVGGRNTRRNRPASAEAGEEDGR